MYTVKQVPSDRKHPLGYPVVGHWEIIGPLGPTHIIDKCKEDIDRLCREINKQGGHIIKSNSEFRCG